MKDFKDFQEYLRENESDIWDILNKKIDPIDKEAQNLMTHSDYFSIFAVMEILERYHCWLNAEE